MNRIRPGALTLLLPGLLSAATAGAGTLGDNLSAYTSETAEGYLKPLQEAFGQALNANLYTTAALPDSGLHARFEIKAMSVFFQDGDRTFLGTTGPGFVPEQTAEVPTVVGSGQSVTVEGEGGTEYVFPGGFDLTSLTVPVPQLTLRGYATEVMVRWVGFDVEDEDVGHVVLWGVGIRHGIDQYFDPLPVRFTASFHYHRFNVESDLLDVESLVLGGQASRAFGMLTAFGGLGYQVNKMTAEWTATVDGVDEKQVLDATSERSLHLVAGGALGLGILEANVAVDYAERFGVSGGLSVGF